MFDLIDLKGFSKDIEKIYQYIQDNYNNVMISRLWSFNQLWSSTALGFGGWGGSAMTEAITTVIEITRRNENKKFLIKNYLVFFKGSFAYYVETPNEAFLRDLDNKEMASVDIALKKYQSTT